LEKALMDRLVFAIYRAVSVILGALPLRVVFRIGEGLGSLAYWVAPPYRRLVLHNLKIAFGREKTPAELRAIARRHFALLGANLFSNIKLPKLSREELQKVVTVEGLETMREGNINNGGFVMVISHLGSWEMFAQLSPIVFGCKVGTIFQALGNQYIDAEIRRDRARLGLELFERKEGFVKACQFMREGGAVGVLVDQHAGDAGLWCPFFSRLSSTSTLAATLGLRTDAWLVPAAVYTDGVARWRCVILGQMKPHGQDANAITLRINEMLEDQIRRSPEDWFWVHNRWKTPKPKFLLATYKRGTLIPHGFGPSRQLQPFRILIRSSNWLGDAIMSVPAVRAIKRGRQDAHVTILTPAKLAAVWKNMPEVDEVIEIEPEESVFAVAKKVRRDFDAAILFPNSLRVALETWLAGIPRRVGYPGHHRRWLLNQIFEQKKKKKKKPEPAPPPRHQVHHYLELAGFVGTDVSPEDARLSEAVPAGHPSLRKPVIGVCTGAEYGPAKRWLPERFAETMRIVHERTGCTWRMFGVEKDRPIAEAVLQAAGTPCEDRVGKTTLEQLMIELRACDLLLTNDTGAMHLAAFLGVRTVSIFGSTEPALTGPLGEGHTVLRHHVECSPCFLRECPIDFRCMKAVEVSEAVDAVMAALPNRTELSPELS
jgi:heptosyltransferase II